MLRKSITVLLILAIVSALYGATLVVCQQGAEEGISVLDVCSKKAHAGFMAAPVLPEATFTFLHMAQFVKVRPENRFHVPHIYLSALERPPAA